MPDHLEPLLRQDEDGAPDPQADLERGLGSGHGNDFRHLIDTQPEAVIKYAIV